jgi:nicotinate-nucleotide pyrophosphorylase (carboxylating)
MVSRGSHAEEGLLFPLTREETKQVVREALLEDDAFNDVTTIATVVSDRRSRCHLIAREGGVIAGIQLAREAFRQLDADVVMRVDHEDGQTVGPMTPVMFLNGSARGLLSAERVALNFMQRLSGIATTTAKYVDEVRGTKAKILDTRKTTPGWRRLEKFAVRAGGGTNHRMDLATAVLIKDNHLAAVDGDITLAIERCRMLATRGTKIEIECDTTKQVRAAVAAGADIILLDNMSTDLLRECVEIVGDKAITEASGGVTLETVRAIAETGVDWISVGALTHSVKALDLALDFDE